jgi:hypothetical protein
LDEGRLLVEQEEQGAQLAEAEPQLVTFP